MAPKQIPQKLMLISFLNGLCFYAPVALLIRTQNGISISQFFILQMILSIGIFLTEIPAGYLSDRIGYKNTMVLSQLFSAHCKISSASVRYILALRRGSRCGSTIHQSQFRYGIGLHLLLLSRRGIRLVQQ